MTKKTIITAVCAWLGEWISDAEFSPINVALLYISCRHKDSADISLLKEFGIDVPKYFEEKHWERGYSEFAFFLDFNSFNKIVEHAKTLKQEKL